MSRLACLIAGLCLLAVAPHGFCQRSTPVRVLHLDGSDAGPGSDFNNDGVTNPDDLSDYINAYFEGGC